MPAITINPAGKVVEAETGSTLLAAILAAGEKITSKCEGKGECAYCHIYVHDGRKTISRIQKLENEKLDTIVGVGSKSRLACQCVIGTEPVTIELLGFASGG